MNSYVLHYQELGKANEPVSIAIVKPHGVRRKWRRDNFRLAEETG